jgi:tRNA modification GTPase
MSTAHWSDTICAIATPPGRGAIAIVRASGPGVRALTARVLRTKKSIRPHRLTTVEILDAGGSMLDRGIAVFSPSPHSYTGEDVLELHVHGSPVVARETLRALLECGARLAAPGEFTRRAFINGKIELNSASAVADLIDAETRAAARAALANLCGSLSARITEIANRLQSVHEELAAAVDFPDEVVDPPREMLSSRLGSIREELETLLRAGELGKLVREGVAIAIVGPPNAGKSSLLNALLGEDRALVSELPGTTRDTIEESLSVEGVPVRLIDTAGIRSHADRLESAGIDRTMRVLEQARVALVVIDGSQSLDAFACDVLDRTARQERVIFFNKADLGNVASHEFGKNGAIVGSVYDPTTLAALRSRIADVGWGGETIDLSRPHLASAVELDAATASLRSINHSLETLAANEPCDLICGDLRDALAALKKITGEAVTEDVLDGIFSRFCIGK